MRDVAEVMPPAGLEPAALCLASSIRLSLTARSKRVCWLDYILDITVPTRIVSEESHFAYSLRQVSCGLPNPHGFLLRSILEYQRLSGRSRIWGRPLNEFFKLPFPIKAPTRQMLYPLSYRGTCLKRGDVSMSDDCHGQLAESQ